MLAAAVGLAAGTEAGLCQDRTVPVAAVVRGVGQSISLPAEGTVLGVQIHDHPGDAVWEIQFRDPNFKGNRRAVVVKDGRPVSDKPATVRAFLGGDLASLPDADLALPVDRLFGEGARQAEGAGQAVAFYRYVLSKAPGEAVARWRIFGFDAREKLVGRVVLNARDGTLLSTSWGEDARRAAAADTPKSEMDAFGKSVGRTFKGVGADLEQFFTGKRTLDKE